MSFRAKLLKLQFMDIKTFDVDSQESVFGQVHRFYFCLGNGLSISDNV